MRNRPRNYKGDLCRVLVLPLSSAAEAAFRVVDDNAE